MANHGFDVFIRGVLRECDVAVEYTNGNVKLSFEGDEHVELNMADCILLCDTGLCYIYTQFSGPRDTIACFRDKKKGAVEQFCLVLRLLGCVFYSKQFFR